MKKIKIVALALAIVFIFAGCSLISVNEEKVSNQVVATVNGTPIYRHEVDRMLENYAYSSGVDVSEVDTDTVNALLDQLVDEEIYSQKVAELGLTLTDEEKQENQDEADSTFSSLKETFRTQVEAEAETDSTIDVEAETEKRFNEYTEALGYTPADYTEELNNLDLFTKLGDYAKGLAEVTDEDVRKWYDDTLAVQQAEMDADPTLFGTDMGEGLICTYVPEDTVAVKHVLITYKDTDLAEVARKLYSDGKTEEAMALLKDEIAKIKPLAQDIENRLKNGESIDSLIALYGEDPGMTSGTSAVSGYFIGASTKTYLPEFMEAALKLTNVGDVSDPVETYYGLHVLQTIKVYKKGVIPFDDIKDQIKEALLPGKQDAKYDEMLAQWKAEAKVTYDRGRLFN